MSVQVRRRREAAAFLSTYVGAQGELLVDTTNNRVQVHDGATPGGWPAARLADLPSSTSPLALAQGGTGMSASSVSALLAALGIIGRTNVADAAYLATIADRTIAFTALTAARSVTLPAANAYPTGTALTILDESGACSSANAITIARAGSDTINGGSSVAITSAYGYVALECNGTSRWTVIDSVAVVGSGGSTAANALTGTVLATNVVTSSLTSVGTLTGGATGAGFTLALGTSTLAGAVPLANGGTGATSAGSARAALGAAASGANGDISSLSGLTTALSVAQGGTGVTTSTGSGSNVLATNPTLVTPALGTPSSATLTNATGLPLTTGVTGMLPVANGGTGGATASAARSGIGAAASGNNTDITSLGGLTTALSVAQGGTGATSTSAALTSLGAVATSMLGVASGVATLGGDGRLAASQVPSSLLGAVVYQGTWNASANSPALTSGTGTKGNYYKVSMAGSTTLDGVSQWNAGDTAIFDGTTWDKINGVANEVLGVNGYTGAVTLRQTDIAGSAKSGANSDITSIAGLTTALSVGQGGTGTTTSTGSGSVVLATAPTLVTPALGTPASGVLSNATGLPISTGLSGAGTGVLAALGTNVGSSGAVVINSGALGTPSSATLTNATGLPLTTGVTGTLPVVNGGTGGTTAVTARTGIGAAASGANTDITSLGGLTTALSVAQGGTGASTASGAVTSLGAVATATLGAANGVATLDGTGKLTAGQIPASLVGAVVYQGTWNASTNSPALASGTGTKGNYYKVSTAGTTTLDGVSQWNAGDTAIFDGTTWDKIDGVANEVLSVNGYTGVVTLRQTDIAGAAKNGANTDITSLGGLTTALSVSQGGTGTAAYTIGDVLYASASSALAKLSAGTAGTVLTSNGPGTAPSWQVSSGGGGSGSTNANALTGTTLASNVVSSSLTSLGTLTSLSVSGTVTLPANSIPLAAEAQAAALTLRGNPTGSTANVADVALTAHIDAAFGSTRGAMLYRGASGWAAIAPGSSGSVLTSNGAGSDPSYQASGGGGGATAPRSSVRQTVQAGPMLQTGAVTISIATPAVITWTGVNLAPGAPIVFSTNGALPAGITPGTTYFVSVTGLAPGSFSISTNYKNALAGTNVATSGSQSGTQTAVVNAPAFLPYSNASSLTLTTQYLTSTSPLVFSGANGFGAAGQNDLVYQFTTNQSWTLPASSTVYIAGNASTGAMTFLTLPPIYQYGGVISSVNGQFTFDYCAAVGYLGNGTAAVATPLVLLGEATTSASGITSATAYAYNGYFDTGYINNLPTAALQFGAAHNLGCEPAQVGFSAKNLTAEGGFAVGQVYHNPTVNSSSSLPVTAFTTTRLTGSIVAGSAGSGWYGVNTATGASLVMTNANWAPRLVVRRGWLGA